MRNGDLDIYSMDTNGKHVKQLTHELDTTAAHFSRKTGSGSCIALIIEDGPGDAEYKELLKQNLIVPPRLRSGS